MSKINVKKFIRDTLSVLRAEVPEDIKKEINTQRVIREANKDKIKDGHSADKMMPIIKKNK